MTLYEFCIIASGLDPQAEDFEERFYEMGCDDATISFQRGRIIMEFGREAPSLDEALASALEDIRRAGATPLRVEPDPLVSMSDIAARSGLTRAAISLYAKGERGADFPSPVARVTTDSPLWLWSDVARWLAELGKLPPTVAREAQAIEAANGTLAGDHEWVPQAWARPQVMRVMGFAEPDAAQPFETEPTLKR